MKRATNWPAEIRRRRGTLSQARLARVLDRSQKWLSFVEAGKIRLDEPTAAKILAAIERLLSLDEMPISQVKVDDLALPRRS